MTSSAITEPGVDELLGGRYRVDERIDSEEPFGSAEAIVFSGWDNLLRRRVRLDVLAEDSADRDDFRRAIRRHAELVFDHIVTIYDAGLHTTAEGRLHWVASEYLEPLTLEECQLTAAQVLALTRNLAATMNQLQRAGISHGNLNTKTVRLVEPLDLRITDFRLQDASVADDLLGFRHVLLSWLRQCSLEFPQLRELSRNLAQQQPSFADISQWLERVSLPTARPRTTTKTTSSRFHGKKPNTPLSGLGRQQRNSAIAIPGVLILILLGVVSAFWAVSASNNSAQNGAIRIPTVAGQSAAEAKTKLASSGLKWGGQKIQTSETVPAGKAIGTDPSAGEKVADSTIVVVLVSSGKQRNRVPATVGEQLSLAKELLVAQGMNVQVLQKDSEQSEDTVLSMSPGAGQKINIGSTVVLQVASGYLRVPNHLIGTSSADALTALHDLGLTVQLIKVPSAGAKIDTVKSITPFDRVPVGGTVTIYVTAPVP
ncbi:PASTA domain-containing protein [Psychromicrobium lacuslunae]|uniref:PASTA domain-containing protein n=1 Tax=Psychromicrobium lacuslunae TaxID=1618207 RepID=A0A0D4BZP6_9MICC|nr:PASTA domain-containing protein [Psychromicrobium lacuslunae]AJT41610.1 hypothetical protein UM93_08965 [Psychromicrobium lacuslunae]